MSFSFDFKDGANSSTEYLYDANGNMVQDKNKGIAQIQYNHLNMPTRITYDNGNMIDYLYSASGAKLKVTHTTNKLLMVNTNFYLQDHQGPRSNKEGLIIFGELRACLARSAGEQVEPLGEGGIIGNLSSNEGLQETSIDVFKIMTHGKNQSICLSNAYNQLTSTGDGTTNI